MRRRGQDLNPGPDHFLVSSLTNPQAQRQATHSKRWFHPILPKRHSRVSWGCRESAGRLPWKPGMTL